VLFGSRVSWATGQAGEIEQAVITEQGSTPEALIQSAKACGFRGERRSLRVRLGGAGVGARWVHSDAVVRSSAWGLCHERASRTHENTRTGLSGRIFWFPVSGPGGQHCMVEFK
jgi:hypothetical protein